MDASPMGSVTHEDRCLLHQFLEGRWTILRDSEHQREGEGLRGPVLVQLYLSMGLGLKLWVLEQR